MSELRTVLPFVKPYWRGILLGFLLTLVSSAFGAAIPALLGLGIDAPAQPGAGMRSVFFFAALILLAAALGGAARYGMRLLLNGISRRIEVDLRDAFVAHMISLDATFFGRHRTGDLMTRATSDTSRVREAVGPGIMYLISTISMTALCLTRMISESPRLTAITLVPLILLPPVVLRFGRVIHARSEEIQDQLGEISNFVQENLAGVRIVRAYVREEAQQAEFEALNQTYLDRNMALARTSSVFHPTMTLLGGASMMLLLWFGGREVAAGRLTEGSFVAFGLYLVTLAWPMIALGWVTNLFQRGAASMKRINRIMATRPALAESSPSAALTEVHGAIEFRDVRFRYPDSERDVLDGIDFQVAAGETVAIVGPTGSGKSTIVALLARLYDPAAGDVLIDGVPVRDVPADVLRAALAIVPQDAFVFSETIGENIALGAAAEQAEERILHASRVAHLEEAVREFPAGYDTLLGERGVNLSGGQRQRTTLARAIAQDPKILVLDDALSAVDTHTESRILTGLRDVLSGRTAIIVSHRVTAVMHADHILVLADGRIVERGTHTALLERGGLYATLLRR